jgi:hypothetical protein
MSDVAKYSVVDPRIVQNAPSYAVEKGALSLTNVTQRAIAATTSQQSFNIQVPSENVFVDRAVDWQCGVQLVLTFEFAAAQAPGYKIFEQGVDWAPAALPLHQCVSTMSATINDTTTTMNTSDILPQVLRLVDMKDVRRQRTCPTMLDRHYVYPEGAVPSSPLASFDYFSSNAEEPNGAWGQVQFYTSSTFATAAVAQTVGRIEYVDGQPQISAGANTAGPFTLYLQVQSTEKLVLSPFIFADDRELSTGLFGVQNIQMLMNIQAPTRVLRTSAAFQASLAAGGQLSVSYSTGATNATAPWVSPTLQVQFLTPALDVPLPPKSVVPYMEFPRYITSGLQSFVNPAGGNLTSLTVSSNTITLPNIPDYLMIYAKPTTYADSSNCDWVYPISNISLNFDNFSGLLSSHTQAELYKMSVNNGVDLTWSEWTGLGYSALDAAKQPLVGGPLVLRPGRDISLQTGQAPGIVGNFSVQFSLTLQNPALNALTPQIYVVAISSGFFETIKGSSRIIKGVVTEQDVLSAPTVAPVVSDSSLSRLVGGVARYKDQRNARAAVQRQGARSSASQYM